MLLGRLDSLICRHIRCTLDITRSSLCARLAPAAHSRARAHGPIEPAFVRALLHSHALFRRYRLSRSAALLSVPALLRNTPSPLRSYALARASAPRVQHVRQNANPCPLTSGSNFAASPSVSIITTCAPRPPLPTIPMISCRVGNDINLLCCTQACQPLQHVASMQAQTSHHLSIIPTLNHHSTT